MYGVVGVGKTYLSKLIGMNAISSFGYKIRFYTVASLVNQLVNANQKIQLAKLMNQIEKLDLLILDEIYPVIVRERRSRTAFPDDFDVL